MMNEVLRDYRLRSLTVCQVRLTFEGWHSSATGSPKGQVGNRSSSGLSGKPLTSSLGAFLTFTKGKRNAKSSFTKINGKLRGNGIKEQESAKCDAFSTGHLLILTCDRILLLQDMGGEGDGKDQHPYENDGEPRRYAPLSSDPNDIFLSISLSQILQVEICEDGCGVDIEYMNPSPKYQKSSSTLLDETDSDNDQASEYSFPSPERFPLLSALVSGGRGALKRKLGSLSGRAPTSMRGASSLEGGIVRILLHTKNSQTAINLKNAIQTTCKRFLEALLWLDRGLPTTVDSVLGVTTVSAEYGSQSNGKGIVLGRGFAWGETLRISGEPVCIHIDLSTPLGPRSCDFCCRGEEKALKNGVHRVQTMQTNSGTVKNGKEQLDVYVTIELAYLKQSPIGAASLDRRRVKTKREFTPWGWKPEGEILLFALSVFVCCTATLFIRTTSGSWLIVTILGINMVLSCLRIVSWWVRPHLAHLPIARTLHESDGYEEPAHTEAQFTRLGQCVGTCLSLKFVRAEIIEDVHKSHELAEPPSYDFSADLHGRISLEIDDEMPPIARKLSRTMSLQKTLVMVNDDVPRVDVDGGLIDVGAMAASQRLVVSSPHSQSFTTPNTSHGVFNLGESNDNHMKRDIQMQHMFGTLEFSPQSTKQLDGLDGPHLHDDKVSEVQEETACASNFSQTIAELAVISPYITDDLFERYLFACEGDSEMALNRLRATAEWRAENDIDKILDSPIPKFELIKSAYLHTVLGRTRDGLPVLLDGSGGFKSALSILRSHAVAPAEIVQQYIFIMEWVIQELAPESFPGGKYVRIYDLKGIGLLDIADQESMKLGQRLMEVVENHFPERMAKAFIINAPPFFSTLWNVVRPMLNARTAAKISITRHKKATLAALRTLMDDDVIPSVYGGTSRVGLSPDDMCSWYCSPEEIRLRAHVARINNQ